MRRAHEHRQLVRRLDDARRLTERPDLGVDDAAAAIAALDGERISLEAERGRLERLGRDLAARREEYADARGALAALTAIDDRDATADGEAYDRARAALSRLADREAQVARGAELERDRAQAQRLAGRQAAARALAAELFPPVPEPGKGDHGGPDDRDAGDAGDARDDDDSRDNRDRGGGGAAASPPPIMIKRSGSGGAYAGELALAPGTADHARFVPPVDTGRAVRSPDPQVGTPLFRAFARTVGDALFPSVSAQATGQGVAAQPVAHLGALGEDPGVVVVRELESVERELRELDVRAESRRTEAALARQRDLELRARLASLDERAAGWQRATALAGRLAAAGTVPTTRAELTALRSQLALDQHALTAQRAALAAHREELQQRATAVERSGTSLDPELLRLRDELGAELLASRFEDLDLATASWVEARLGPLTGALIVDDLDAAAAAVEASNRLSPTVWLVRADATLSVGPPEDLAELADARDVVSPEPFGLRVTRRLPRPSLGRRARE
ncbi:MAG: hypothetical protein ACREBE_21055, partial [bacterium]